MTTWTRVFWGTQSPHFKQHLSSFPLREWHFPLPPGGGVVLTSDDLLSFCVKPGDFLKDRLPEADLYIACGLLRGRPDHEALLSRIAGSCPPGEAACRGPCPKQGDGFC